MQQTTDLCPLDPNALLRLPAVKQLTGLSRSSIYAMEKRGDFPRRVQLGPRTVAWAATEVIAFIRQRMQQRPALANA